MKHRKPDSKQTNMEFDRGEMLSILRDCRLGDPRRRNDRKPIAKLLLRTLDDHIGKNRTFTIGVDQLAAEAEISISTAYQWLSWLNQAGLIGFDPVPDGRREYWICWRTLKLLTSEGRSSTPADEDDPFQNLDLHSRLQNPIPESGPPFQNLESSYKEERPKSAIKAPSSSPSVDPMVVMVQGVINRAKDVIAQARSVGMTDEKITAVFDHWKAHPGRWEVGILVDRLRRSDAADQPADQGWFGEPDGYRPPPAPVIDLEPLHGPSLDAMAEGELKELISDREVRWQNECLQFGRKHRDFRPVLLKLLHRRKSAAVC